MLCRPLLCTGAVEGNPAKKDIRQKRDPAICWWGCTINMSRKASVCQGRTSCVDKRGCFKRVRATNFPCTQWTRSREKEVVFTKLSIRGGEQPLNSRKSHTKGPGDLLSSVLMQLDLANSKSELVCYRDAQGKDLIQSLLVVTAGLSSASATVHDVQWQRESRGNQWLSNNRNPLKIRNGGCEVNYHTQVQSKTQEQDKHSLELLIWGSGAPLESSDPTEHPKHIPSALGGQVL